MKPLENTEVLRVNRFMQFISEICDILNIREPDISFDCSMFPRRTTLAMADIKNRVLHLRQNAAEVVTVAGGVLDVSLCFSISHELRHIWQADTALDYWFRDYSSGSSDINAYNLQRAEIDANAFADMACIALFGVETIFVDMSPEVGQKIVERRRELEKIYTDKQ